MNIGQSVRLPASVAHGTIEAYGRASKYYYVRWANGHTGWYSEEELEVVE